jgi:sugar phosphate isomerase/epimerase
MKIGLRLPGACSKLPLNEFAAWCKDAGFDAIDLGSADPVRAKAVTDAGLSLGTSDLPGTQKLLSPDSAERADGIAVGTAALEAMAAAGFTRAFCTFFPSDGRQSRKDSLTYWKESFPEVAKAAERFGVRIAVEGWPGPNNSALGVTPEQLRIMLSHVDTPHFGLNYDPSHLVRIGVDYQRFLSEFGARVVHAHGKDTRRDAEGAYLYGNLGPSVDSVIGWSGGDWRYCIPGEGDVDWTFVCAELQKFGFDSAGGIVAIELEDFRYNGTEEGEKRGLVRARAHLLNLL